VKSLLDNRHAPITHSWGFLEISLQEAGAAAVRWAKTMFSSVETTELEASLPEALQRLLPLVIPPNRRLLLSTASPWTAYFDNGENGGDPAGFVGHLSQALHCRGLAVTCIPDAATFQHHQGTLGAVRFELYAPEPREWLNQERTITAMNEGQGWFFEATGVVQAFESSERYGAKAPKDRFTPDMLAEYCLALGIRLFDPSFYGHSGILITTGDPVPADHDAVFTQGDA
jgi:hypothetical protein